MANLTINFSVEQKIEKKKKRFATVIITQRRNHKLLLCGLGPHQEAGQQKNWSIHSLVCSPPRKSLVKGERFIR